MDDNQKIRDHYEDITFQNDDKEIKFSHSDDTSSIGNIEGSIVTVNSDKIPWKKYFIINSIKQLEENSLPDSTSNKKTISCRVFRNQKIIDEILEKYSTKDINFVNCFFVFSGSIKLSLSCEKNNIRFSNCSFKGQLELLGMLRRLSFMSCDFLGIVKFFDIKFFNIKVKSCVFNKGVLFPGRLYKLTKDSLLYFKNTIFRDIIKMQYSQYDSDISFEKSKFHKEVDLNIKSKFFGMLVFKDIKFYENVSFSNSKFENRIILNGVTFKSNIDLSYTEFLDVIEFSSSNYFEKINLKNTKFHKDSIFEEATFNNHVDFRYTTFKENASFRAAEFKEGLNLARVNINNSAILDFYDAEINGNKCSKEISIKDKQETYRILKHESLKKNDTIKAVEFYKEECENHYQTLKFKSRDFFNKLILGFEKYVSDYGTSAFKSLIWLVSINIAFTILVLLKPYLFSLFLSLFSVFLIGYLYSLDKQSSTLNKVVYFTFSIFVSYVILSFGTFIYELLDWLTIKSTQFLAIKAFKGISLAMLIHIVINATLVYEIVKSFRKYSRKL
ncbi:pentapeptide repeat-containing protein [Francisella sp. LA112445]|uniref:pentapeptide repeat-containing protein n=1 Tax=Francisella sp. LA112445 TaxID=1395624 RepID=UPI001788BA53|nr:pentapeptide repeat-containing protein [Francisella sp. LA112445]QIW10607.1 hypothetical protein FIP56_07805 [Francisella sp. LA112445]